MRLRRLNGRFTIVVRRTSGPGGGRKKGPRGRKGSVTPLALHERGTRISLSVSQPSPGGVPRNGEQLSVFTLNKTSALCRLCYATAYDWTNMTIETIWSFPDKVTKNNIRLCLIPVRTDNNTQRLQGHCCVVGMATPPLAPPSVLTLCLGDRIAECQAVA